ncbi:anti-sigma factor [Chloracidobacterium thermophilum]|uniref:anti-sigma factor family protein n=1 Tax=Chloracidobacterium thermophilum TaxID=458033 RepID=UPI000738746C|nr:zf-HC2 domain-containing protein [Chloracidobacterium thermophilum]
MTTPRKPTTDKSTMACDRSSDLVAYLYGEATPAEIASFERHLQTCPVCRAELEGLQTVRTALQSWEMDAVAPRLQLVVRPTAWQAWREFFALLPLWGKLATGAAAIVLVLSLANLRLTVGPQGVSLSTGWLAAPEMARMPRPPAAAPAVVDTALRQTGASPAADEAALRQVAARLVTEMLAAQSQARDAELEARELEARMNAVLDARLKQQRTELVRLVGQLNREQRLQLAAWIRESEQRSNPDLLDLVSTFPVAEGGDE